MVMIYKIRKSMANKTGLFLKSSTVGSHKYQIKMSTMGDLITLTGAKAEWLINHNYVHLTIPTDLDYDDSLIRKYSVRIYGPAPEEQRISQYWVFRSVHWFGPILQRYADLRLLRLFYVPLENLVTVSEAVDELMKSPKDKGYDLRYEYDDDLTLKQNIAAIREEMLS